MRLLVLGLLALAPLAAAAEPLPPPALLLTVPVPTELLSPMGAPMHAPVALRVACDPTLAAGQASVAIHVAQAPAWASVQVVPATQQAELSRCVDGWLDFEATLTATAGPDAPAFAPQPVLLAASAQLPLRPAAHTEGQTILVAGYFSILDVSAETTQVALGSRGFGEVPLRVLNFGNAPTRVAFEALADAPLRIEAPDAAVVGSRQHGGGMEHAALLRIHQVEEADAPLVVALRWSSAYALDPLLRGEGGLITIVVHPGDVETAPYVAEDDPLARVPGAGPLAIPLVALAALLLRRAR